MSYTGGGPYYAQQYPEYNGILWNGRCGNPECIYHWHPPEDAAAETSHKEKRGQAGARAPLDPAAKWDLLHL